MAPKFLFLSTQNVIKITIIVRDFTLLIQRVVDSKICFIDVNKVALEESKMQGY